MEFKFQGQTLMTSLSYTYVNLVAGYNEKISRSVAIGCIDFVMHHLFFKNCSISCLCFDT